MKKLIAFLSLSLVVAPAFASKNCEELKSEIAAKLDAKGVHSYTLEIIAKEQANQPTLISDSINGSAPTVIAGGIEGQKPTECADCESNARTNTAVLKIVGSCEAGTKKITYKKD